MKAALTTAIWIVAWAWLCLALSSCVTETIETTETSKSGLITVTKRTLQKPDPLAWTFAEAAATAYAPRGVIIREK